MDKSKSLVNFGSSLIRMIRLASEMNFKIDPELLTIAEEDSKVREAFSAYSHEKPQEVFGYNLYKAFLVDKK